MVARVRARAELCRRWFRRVLLDRRTHALEAGIAVIAVMAGGFTLLPGPAFTAHTGMYILPDWFTGCVLLGHGLGSALVLRWGDVHMCRRSAILSVGLWSAIGYASLLGEPGDPFVAGMAFGVAALAAWVVARLWRKFRPPIMVLRGWRPWAR